MGKFKVYWQWRLDQAETILEMYEVFKDLVTNQNRRYRKWIRVIKKWEYL